MKGNFHVRFLEGGGLATARSYSEFSGIKFCALLRLFAATLSTLVASLPLRGFALNFGRKAHGRCTEGPGRWWKVLEGGGRCPLSRITHHASAVPSGAGQRPPVGCGRASFRRYS